MKQNVDKIAPYLPWVGLILIVAGAIVTTVTRTFDLTNNLLLGGGALLLLLFAMLRPDDVRHLFSGRQARYGTSTFLSILFFVAIAIMIYWLAYKNNDWRLDLTEANEFTPLAETVDLLESIQEPVHVIGFYTVAQAGQQSQAKTILDSLKAVSDNFTYEFVDPESNPLLASSYDLNLAGTLVFIRNQDQPDEVFSKANGITDTDIHTALVKVINPVSKKLYLIAGHGEPSKEDFAETGTATIMAILEDAQGFTVEELNLLNAGVVPDDASAVALIGQQSPLDSTESQALNDYLNSGGSLFIAREPVIDPRNLITYETIENDGLNTLLAEWGITLRQDIIVDPELARAGQSDGLTFLGAEYGNSPIITEEIRTFSTLFDLARSIETTATENVTITSLVQTSGEAWGETDIESLVTVGARLDDGVDAAGPLQVGVSAENSASGGRLVIFGDSTFLTNQAIQIGGNAQLLTNSLNWLSNDEISIALSPRETIERQINIPDQQLRFLRLIGIWLAPALMLVIGVMVWSSRRRNQ